MPSLFQAIGLKLGKTAANAKNVFDLVAGGEAESLQAEIRLGHDLAAAMLERLPLAPPSKHTAFVGDVGGWLAGCLKNQQMPFTFRVVAERRLNAFALPGGHLFVSGSLLDLCQWQRDEIAFILGHEMAHVVLRHALDRVVADSVFSLLLRQSSLKSAVSGWLGRAGHQALNSAYSRENELEADHFALGLLRAAGGDPAAGRRLFEKLAPRLPTQAPGPLGEYFDTHPPLSERLALLP